MKKLMLILVAMIIAVACSKDDDLNGYDGPNGSGNGNGGNGNNNDTTCVISYDMTINHITNQGNNDYFERNDEGNWEIFNTYIDIDTLNISNYYKIDLSIEIDTSLDGTRHTLGVNAGHPETIWSEAGCDIEVKLQKGKEVQYIGTIEKKDNKLLYNINLEEKYDGFKLFLYTDNNDYYCGASQLYGQHIITVKLYKKICI